jgi:hypothetical protein
LLGQLSQTEYSNSCAELSNATIESIRDILLKMFQCLENQYDLGVVNYDKRERNTLIQTDTTFAIENIGAVQKKFEKENKNITLLQIIDGEEIRIDSNYNRELLYNLGTLYSPSSAIKVAILQCETDR